MSKRLLIWFICLLMPCTALGETMTISPFNPEAMDIVSNRHAKPDKSPMVVDSFLSTQGFDMVAQSEQGELWLSSEYHTIRLVDKVTGYIWGAIDLEDAKDLNKSWRSYASSIVAIECYDKKNTEKRYGLYGNAQVEYRMIPNGFACHINFNDLGISMEVEVVLHGERLTFRLVEDSFLEQGDYRCKSLAFVPYMGSVHEDAIEGWFLLPDGPGALMRFASSNTYVAGFDKKVYGKDLAIDGLQEAQSIGANRPDDYLMADNQVLMPVYGIAHGIGQNGLLCTIEDGQAYASVVATPAGLGNMKYNSIMMRFEYRQKYSLSSNRQGAGMLTPQSAANVLTPSVSFQLLHGGDANYDGMALQYKQRLMDEGTLQGSPDGGMHIALTVLGEDVCKMPLWKETRVFTTLKQTEDIVNDMQSKGIGNITLRLSHYTHRNMAGEALSPRIGTSDQLATLKETLTSLGGRLELYLDPMRANADQINLRLQAANTMGTTPIVLVRNNWDLVYRETYYYRPFMIEEKVTKAINEYDGYTFAIDQLGNRLFGDYTSEHSFSRIENMAFFASLLTRLNQSEGLSMYSPNQSVWQNTKAFYDIPLVNGQYLYETDTVPFLPIVLSGTMEVYAPPLNTGAFSQDRLLRMIEYGVYPSFSVTHAQSMELVNTPLADYFSTCYADWANYIQETYDYMKHAFEATAGRSIVSHRAMEQGRMMVTYEGNTIIYINYTDESWLIGNDVVAPHDYLVKGGA